MGNKFRILLLFGFLLSAPSSAQNTSLSITKILTKIQKLAGIWSTPSIKPSTQLLGLNKDIRVPCVIPKEKKAVILGVKLEF